MIQQVASNGSDPRSSKHWTRHSLTRQGTKRSLQSLTPAQERCGTRPEHRQWQGNKKAKYTHEVAIILVKHTPIFRRWVCSVLIRTWFTHVAARNGARARRIGEADSPCPPKSRPRRAGPCALVRRRLGFPPRRGSASDMHMDEHATALDFPSSTNPSGRCARMVRNGGDKNRVLAQCVSHSKGRRRFAETPAAHHVSMFTVFGCGHISFVT